MEQTHKLHDEKENAKITHFVKEEMRIIIKKQRNGNENRNEKYICIHTTHTHKYIHTHDWNASWETLNGPPFGARVLTHTHRKTDKHTYTPITRLLYKSFFYFQFNLFSF